MRHSYLLIIAIMLTVISSRTASAQSIAVKSNILYDLTGTLNLGGEIRCDDTHSFSLSVNYNPWNLGENKKMKHILVQPNIVGGSMKPSSEVFRSASPLRPIQFQRNHPFHHSQEQPLPR